MNTCDTCKFWGPQDNAYRDYRHCTNPKLSESTQEDGAFGEADSFGWIMTGPKFGCIHHEAIS